MAQVLVINSSFRKNSNSSALGLRVAAGAEKAGHSVKVINIGRLRLEPCRGCQACLRPGAHYCVIQDDMGQFYPDLEQAEIIVYVSPVYWFNLGGQIKQFIDRCYAVASKGQSFGRKKLAAAFAFEGDDPFDSGCINAIRSLQDICSYTGAAWGGVIYGKANAEGEMLNRPDLLEQAEKFGSEL